MLNNIRHQLNRRKSGKKHRLARENDVHDNQASRCIAIIHFHFIKYTNSQRKIRTKTIQIIRHIQFEAPRRLLLFWNKAAKATTADFYQRAHIRCAHKT